MTRRALEEAASPAPLVATTRSSYTTPVAKLDTLTGRATELEPAASCSADHRAEPPLSSRSDTSNELMLLQLEGLVVLEDLLLVLELAVMLMLQALMVQWVLEQVLLLLLLLLLLL